MYDFIYFSSQTFVMLILSFNHFSNIEITISCFQQIGIRVKQWAQIIIVSYTIFGELIKVCYKFDSKY